MPEFYFGEAEVRRFDRFEVLLERVATGLENMLEDKDELAKTSIIDEPIKTPSVSNDNDLLKVLISAQMFCEQSNCGLCMEAIKVAQNICSKPYDIISTLKKIITETEEAINGGAVSKRSPEILVDLVVQLKSMTGQP